MKCPDCYPQQEENYPQGILVNRIRGNKLRPETLKHFSPWKGLEGVQESECVIPEKLPSGTHTRIPKKVR